MFLSSEWIHFQGNQLDFFNICLPSQRGLTLKGTIPSIYEQPLFGSFVVVVLLFYVHGKHLRSCRDGQLT